MQLFVHDLTVMDFSYLCAKRGVVGESWIVDVVLDGDLNEESMVQDFGKVKKELKYLIDEYVDHKLLVPADCAGTKVIHYDGSDDVEVHFDLSDGEKISFFCPAEAYAFIYSDEVTMASVSKYLKEVLAIHLPDNVDTIELRLRTEVITTPFYHYTHGLKKHDGNCQRIAHGHRSKIDILYDGVPDLDSQAYWADRWQDIYVASVEDQIQPEQLKMREKYDSFEGYMCFAYESSQGYFEMVIHQRRVELIETDSTVECLAQFIHQQQKARKGGLPVEVLAYEGVGKGAMVKG